MVKILRYYSEGPGIDSRWCHWIFQPHISFQPCHGNEINSVPSENEYHEYFVVLEADNLTTFMC